MLLAIPQELMVGDLLSMPLYQPYVWRRSATLRDLARQLTEGWSLIGCVHAVGVTTLEQSADQSGYWASRLLKRRKQVAN